MAEAAKYSFHHRPEYGSENYLIEVTSGVEDPAFIDDLFDAIKELAPKLSSGLDLWMNDEALFYVDSELGQFTLSKDTWGFAFIQAGNNQSVISRIHNLLRKDPRFEKVETDPNDYK